MKNSMICLVLLSFISSLHAQTIPVIDGEWWSIAGNPGLGSLSTDKQEPVDFGIWQANDGTWQLWSCIRHTKEIGKTRLFHGWEGKNLSDSNWKPQGIRMQANSLYGEIPGGLQAPYVLKIGEIFHMFYGNWQDICLALSPDGKHFDRALTNGLTGLFSEGPLDNARDPMVLRDENLWYCYYSAYLDERGGIYCRTSKDLKRWSNAILVARDPHAGKSWWNFECPHVVKYEDNFYLFYTQNYRQPQSRVYRSQNPLNFGEADNRYFAAELPVAAPEIILHEGQYYIAALQPELNGIRVARLKWEGK